MLTLYFRAIYKKDFILFKKYKLQMLITYLSIFVYIFALFNFSKAVGYEDDASNLFKSNPFLFLLTGYMIIDLTITILNIISSQISFLQTASIFEEIVSIDYPFFYMICTCAFPLTLWFFRNAFYFFISIYFFELDINSSISAISLLIFLIFFISFILFLFGLALIAGSFTIIFKRGNPIIIITIALTTIFSGALYPVNVLPDYFLPLSNHIPTTHFLEIFRQFLANNLVDDVIVMNITLLIVGPFFLSLGYLIFYKSLNFSKKNGTTYTY